MGNSKGILAAVVALAVIVGVALAIRESTRPDPDPGPAASGTPALPGIVTEPAPAPPPAPATAPPPPVSPPPDSHRSDAVAPSPVQPPAPFAPPVPAPLTGGMVVAEAVLCRGVDRVERKPLGVADVFHVSDGTLWCFARVTGGSGRKVRAVWHVGGKRHEGVLLEAGPSAPKQGATGWRVWWNKSLDASMAGGGRVEIMDENGRLMKTLGVRIEP